MESHDFKPDLAKRKAERETANAPWPIPSAPSAPERKYEQMRCILPGPAADGTWLVYRDLERKLCSGFGGFSAYVGRGGWGTEREEHTLYVVTYIPCRREMLLELFKTAGRALGVRDLHMERSEFFPEHVRLV